MKRAFMGLIACALLLAIGAVAETAPTVIELERAIPVYSLKPPYGQVGELRPGAKVTVLDHESPTMIRVRFRKGPGVLAEAQCRTADVLRETGTAGRTPVGSWIRPQRVTVAYSPNGEARALILKEIRNARSSIDVGMFYLSDDDLVDALCYQAQRKVTVRLLVGSWMAKAAHKPTLDRLARHGVSVYVLPLPNNGRMHLKCGVFDGETVVAGSANWSPAAFEENFEDTVLIESEVLAGRYREYFESLFGRAELLESGEYSESGKIRNFPEIEKYQAWDKEDEFQAERARSFTTVSRMEVYFCPGREGFEELQKQIRGARERIDIGMYLLTDPDMVRTLEDVARQGRMRMRMLLDAKMLDTGLLDDVHRLQDAGIEIYYFRGERASLHVKTAVIDGQTLWTGTANWTTGAMTVNVEDMLRFDSPDMARHFIEFLDRVQEQCEPFAPLALDEPILEVESEDAFDAAGLRVGLPPTGPRSEYDGVDEARPFTGFAVDATAAYLPDEEYLPVLLDLIRNANQSILVAMYLLSETKSEAEYQEKVLGALERAAGRGVYVYLLLNSPQSVEDRLEEDHSNFAERLRAKEIDVRLNVPGVDLHTKMVVVDQAKILIGSHNWSDGALSGERVYESSVLLVLPQQDPRLADYILGRQVVSDMRNRKLWERELATLRHLQSLRGGERDARIKELEASAQP